MVPLDSKRPLVVFHLVYTPILRQKCRYTGGSNNVSLKVYGVKIIKPRY